MRDKDLQLAGNCNELRQATSEALVWLENNRALVGTQFDALKKELKLASVEARKLSRASQRPTSLAVFGPSQHGKSFLVGGLLAGPPSATPVEGIGDVIFKDSERASQLNFLNEINPQGGAETTGLVTRFSINEQKPGPIGFPVRLRLLSEIDLVKIFANSFVEDLDLDAAIPITHNAISSLLSELSEKASDEPVDMLAAEDVYELEQYLQHNLRSHPLIRDFAATFWPRMDWLAPRLKLADRAKLFSLFWGGIDQFTKVFLELKPALDILDHAEYIFVSLDSITDRVPGKTVLHVATMKAGLADDLSISEDARVALISGKIVNVRKPVITALACELVLQLVNAPWPFFEYTDLLDFPGARSREGIPRDKFFNTQKDPHPIGEAFLRGKVAVMFDNYAADLDLNTLLACHKAEQKSVVSFPNLVENWVGRTHGVDPESRKGTGVNLFMIVTWADILLAESFGNARLDIAIDNKLSLLKSFPSFLKEWTPGESFTNTFLIRNPAGFRMSEFFDIEESGLGEWIERSVRHDRIEKLQEYENAFVGTEVATTYFGEADEKWRAMATPNDGGISLLAARLGPACDADVKFNQIAPKELAVRKALSIALSPFYEDADLQARVIKRTAAMSEVVDCLRQNISIVPKFVGQFHLSQKRMREVYTDYKHGHLFGFASGKASNDSIGATVIKSWINEVERFGNDEHWCASYLLSPDHVRTVIGELEAGMRRKDIATAVSKKISRIEQYSSGSTKHAEYVASAVALQLNDYINYAGLTDDGDSLPVDGEALFKREEHLTADLMPVLADFTDDMVLPRHKYANDWFKAIVNLTRINASSSNGALVDVEQNEKLGRILDLLDEDDR